MCYTMHIYIERYEHILKKKSSSHELIEQCILEALLSLLKKHSYDEITITDITKKAGVSRMAYYRNYDTKDEILLNYFTSSFHAFYKSVQKKKPLSDHEFWFLFFQNICEDENFTIIMNSELWALIFQAYTEYNTLICSWIFQSNPELDTALNRMSLSYQFGGVTLLIKYVLEIKESIDLNDVADTVMSLFTFGRELENKWYMNIPED